MLLRPKTQRDESNFESEENIRKFALDQDGEIEDTDASESEEEEEEEPLSKLFGKDEDEEDRVLRILQDRPPKEKLPTKKRSHKDRELAQKLVEDQQFEEFKKIKRHGLEQGDKASRGRQQTKGDRNEKQAATDRTEKSAAAAEKVGGRKSRRGASPRSELV